MRVTDDLHQMVNYIRDLRNMMIGLDLFIIIGILILIIGLAILTIIGILIIFILKYRNGKQKQKRRRRSNRGKYRFNGIRSEHSTIGNRYMNENSGAFMSKVHLFDDVLICGECSFRTNDINKFGDHESRECSNITKAPSEPESIQCCENTFKNSWKLLQHLKEKHNLTDKHNRDASTTDDSQERRGPQTPSPLPSESVQSEKNHPTALIMNDDHTFIPQLNNPMPTTPTTPTTMPYYSDPVVAATHGTPSLTTSVSVAATPSVSSRSFGESHSNNNTTVRDVTNARDVKLGTSKQTTFNQHTTNFIDRSNGSNKNNSTQQTVGDGTTFEIGTARDHVKQSIKQTTFNQHTTNFIVCCLDSLKPLNV